MKKNIENIIFFVLFGLVAIVALGAVLCGHYWHIGTLLLSILLMFLQLGKEDEE